MMSLLMRCDWRMCHSLNAWGVLDESDTEGIECCGSRVAGAIL